MAAVTDRPVDELAAIVKPSQNVKFGDYQANGVMALAKQIKQNPRALAQQVAEKLAISDMCEAPEVAGPGFINFRLKPQWLAEQLQGILPDNERLGVEPSAEAPVTVVDFSSPNIAKQMHVGHLRSTIIGDVIARVLEFSGGAPQAIIRQNHVGDWGTQFGMLTRYIDFLAESNDPRLAKSNDGQLQLKIEDAEALYREAKQKFDAEPEFAAQSRDFVVKLQSGEAHVLENWHIIREQSIDYCQNIYEQLRVGLQRDHVCGESFYNDRLPGVISELSATSLLQESEGAQCVFLDDFKNKDDEPLPLIVQKSDGAYLYATTDLAAIRYRVEELQARRIIYVTDARQKQHFQMVFACARAAGWAGDGVGLEHVPFGSVLGEDGAPLKTRSGENVKLKDLLDEAVKRARVVVELKAAEREVELSEEEKQSIAEKVGIGAVKYADLSNNLMSDYVFDWDKMLAMDGNTAPYMQYAYARICSIFRNEAAVNPETLKDFRQISLEHPAEQELAKLILRYGEAIEAVARDLRPHLLTLYLFDLAQAFSAFYNQCPVLKSPEPLKSSRLTLCHLTACTISHGLSLLGIETPERM